MKWRGGLGLKELFSFYVGRVGHGKGHMDSDDFQFSVGHLIEGILGLFCSVGAICSLKVFPK